MNVQEVNIDTLLAYENNAKIHTPKQIEQLKESIKEFGFNSPLLVDENNVLIAGHGRLQAMKELGHTTIPVIKLEHLTEVQKKKFIIADNKLSLNTQFDEDILKSEIKNILDIDTDSDWSALGFDDEEVNFLSQEDEGTMQDFLDSLVEEAQADKSESDSLLAEGVEDEEDLPICECCGQVIRKTKDTEL